MAQCVVDQIAQQQANAYPIDPQFRQRAQIELQRRGRKFARHDVPNKRIQIGDFELQRAVAGAWFDYFYRNRRSIHRHQLVCM